MKVSFIVPTRNHRPFITRCVDACLAQHIDDREVIVMDGASTDGTQDVLAGYGERIRWRSEPDAGQSDAVNKAIALAGGDVIAWINSDDYYPDPEVLPAVVAAFGVGPSVDIVYGRALAVAADGRPIRPYRTHPNATPKDVLVRPIAPAMQPAVFFRRSLFADVGGLRTDLHYAMDYDLWLRMFPRARGIRFVDRVMAHATFHPGAKSIAGMRHQVRELAMLKRLHRDAYALGLGDRARCAAGVASLYAYWLAVRLGIVRAG